jgi:hypothetical protein
MRLITSISPNNVDRQQRAISTWNPYEVYSINHESEISNLKELFPSVKFISAKKTGIETFGKHYIPVNEFRDFIINTGEAFMINSDIIINGELKTAKSDLVLYNRYDCKNYDYKYATKFLSGYDAFFITPELAKLIPDTRLCLGQCHWDYLIPSSLLRKGIKLLNPKDPVLFHEVHPIQYSNEMWDKTGGIFIREMGLSGHPNRATFKVYEQIKSKLIPI